ncbi:MAG: TerD family protein [Candidatus Saccharibacteria bacterium]|nr:TerD family protein [Pseudorhodobacter sp.]
MELSAGANASLTDTAINLTIILPLGAEIDITALQVYQDGKVRGDGDMCFFNQPSISGGAIVLSQPAPNRSLLAVQLAKVPTEVEKVVLTATIDGPQTFGSVSGPLSMTVSDITMTVSTAGRSERALILAEIYRRNGQWKIRNVSQGFNGGLAALAAHFGVEVAEKVEVAAKPAAAAPAPKPVNLSKVSLTKTESKISLKKSDGKFGKIRINLNWNQKKRKSGLFGLGSSAIDLDVGAFIEDNHGKVTAVQALGNTFGDYYAFPFVKLTGDDRTGAVSGGEWIEINGDHWFELRRVLIYAFIYEGVPNWAETDGMVRIYVPGQPEIEVSMNEFGSQQGMCAVAMLENVNGEIRVSRELTFHAGHPAMDEAHGWGMRWKAGRK